MPTDSSAFLIAFRLLSIGIRLRKPKRYCASPSATALVQTYRPASCSCRRSAARREPYRQGSAEAERAAPVVRELLAATALAADVGTAPVGEVLRRWPAAPTNWLGGLDRALRGRAPSVEQAVRMSQALGSVVVAESVCASEAEERAASAVRAPGQAASC